MTFPLLRFHIFYSSFLYSKISPGWQFSASQIASNVEKRMALTLPVFIFWL